jgi:hypothetical protein
MKSTSPHSITLRYILLLSSHLSLVLPSNLLPSGFRMKILYAILFSQKHATFPSHRILFYSIIPVIFGKEYKLRRSSLCSFLQPPFTSPRLGSNILLSTLFSNTLSLFSSLNVRDQVLHSFGTTGNLNFCIFYLFKEQTGRKIFLNRMR